MSGARDSVQRWRVRITTKMTKHKMATVTDQRRHNSTRARAMTDSRKATIREAKPGGADLGSTGGGLVGGLPQRAFATFGRDHSYW